MIRRYYFFVRPIGYLCITFFPISVANQVLDYPMILFYSGFGSQSRLLATLLSYLFRLRSPIRAIGYPRITFCPASGANQGYWLPCCPIFSGLSRQSGLLATLVSHYFRLRSPIRAIGYPVVLFFPAIVANQAHWLHCSY